jgi:hypothetical protein
MRLVRNTGTDRAAELIQPLLRDGCLVDVVTPALSLFACAELLSSPAPTGGSRFILPGGLESHVLLGSAADRAARNRLQSRWLAMRLRAWLTERAEIRRAAGGVPQGTMVLRDEHGTPLQALTGSFALTTEGLGLAPGNPLAMIQASETAEEAALLAGWFENQWASLRDSGAKPELLEILGDIASHRAPHLVYALVLHHLFAGRGDELDEEQVIKSATGIRNSVIWRKLYKFQRDGVVGAIDKLNRFGGCIIAASGSMQGREGLVLVEAKAHTAELKRTGHGIRNEQNLARIRGAVDESNEALRRMDPRWCLSCDSHYQLANRFAWSWKLASLGVPVLLVYLGFLNAVEMADQGEPFADAEAWERTVRSHSKGVAPQDVWDREVDVHGTPLRAIIRSVDLPLESHRTSTS